MTTAIATPQPAEVQPTKQHADGNPWANDFTLMTLSLWWVQRTQPGGRDFDQQVASMMASLARQLR